MWSPAALGCYPTHSRLVILILMCLLDLPRPDHSGGSDPAPPTPLSYVYFNSPKSAMLPRSFRYFMRSKPRVGLAMKGRIMQQILRSYATAGVALLGAGMIAVTPLELRSPDAQLRSIQLAGVSDLLGDVENALGGLAGNLDLGDANPLDSLPLVGGLFSDPSDPVGLSDIGNLDVYLNLITQFIQDATTIDGHWVSRNHSKF